MKAPTIPPAARAWLTIGLVAAVLAAQVVIPTLALLHARPAMFGWQMFSIRVRRPVVTAVDAAGGRQQVAVDAMTPRYRADAPYTEAIGPFVCRRFPGTVTVLVEWEAPRPGLEVACPTG